MYIKIIGRNAGISNGAAIRQLNIFDENNQLIQLDYSNIIQHNYNQRNGNANLNELLSTGGTNTPYIDNEEDLILILEVPKINPRLEYKILIKSWVNYNHYCDVVDVYSSSNNSTYNLLGSLSFTGLEEVQEFSFIIGLDKILLLSDGQVKTYRENEQWLNINKGLSDISEQDYIDYGIDIGDLPNIDLSQSFTKKSFISKNSSLLGSGQVFQQTIDTNKYKIKKITIK